MNCNFWVNLQMYYISKCLELTGLCVIGSGMVQNFPKLMNPKWLLAGGLFFTMAEIGGIIGPISIGIIYDYYNNFNYALGFYSLILIVMIIPVMFLKKLN